MNKRIYSFQFNITLQYKSLMPKNDLLASEAQQTSIITGFCQCSWLLFKIWQRYPAAEDLSQRTWTNRARKNTEA